MAPNDPDLRRKLAEAEKEVKRIRFEEALSLPVRAVFRICGHVRDQLHAMVPLRRCRLCCTLSRHCNSKYACSQEAEVVPVSESIDLSSMPVADSYSGPRMAGAALFHAVMILSILGVEPGQCQLSCTQPEWLLQAPRRKATGYPRSS